MKNKIIMATILFLLVIASFMILDENEIVFDLADDIQYQFEYKSEFIEPVVKAYYQKKTFKFIRTSLDIEKVGEVNTSILGEYSIKYKAKKENNENEIVLKFLVVDTTSPNIELIENEEHFTEYGSEYIEEGYSCFDNYDGDITDKVTREVKGDKVIYSVTDSSGNTTVKEREIKYIDTTSPVINFDSPYTAIEVGESYYVGFTAYDLKDGDLTKNVTITGEADIEKIGIYTLTYVVSDFSGNVTTVKRNVYVYKKQADPDSLNPTKKVVYLTFDDGPSSHTSRLLDILDKYNVKATFFVNGKNKSYFYNVGKAYQKGHSIGNHTYSHNYSKVYSSVDNFYSDLNYNGELIYQQTGSYTKLIRFPGGSSNTVSKKYCKGIMSTLVHSVSNNGYKYFDWNVSSGDAGKNSNRNSVYNNVINGIKKRNVSIVLQHDTKGFSVDAVEEIILWGLANGYTFLPLNLSSPTCHHGVKN